MLDGGGSHHGGIHPRTARRTLSATVIAGRDGGVAVAVTGRTGDTAHGGCTLLVVVTVLVVVGQTVEEAEGRPHRLGDPIGGGQVGEATTDLFFEAGPPLAELAPRRTGLPGGAGKLVGAQDDQGDQQDDQYLGRVQ